MTGKTSEQRMAVLHGTGNNAKTEFVRAIEAALGDYAMTTPVETLLTKHGDAGIPNDVARLCGARFVVASETEDGKRLAEGKIKQLTGGDLVSARFLHAEFFDFRPSFKLWVYSNFKPVIRGTDEAIWRRIDLIPFNATIPKEERIKDYFETVLRPELPGILAWMVAGCLEWQEKGLDQPPEVLAATAGYRAEMDVVAKFIGDCCVVGTDFEARAQPLYEAFLGWSEEQGHKKPMTLTAFGLRLETMGHGKRDLHGRVIRQGLALRQEEL
jgi:phage/plasmid primase, P4 family, C-terminal domain